MSITTDTLAAHALAWLLDEAELQHLTHESVLFLGARFEPALLSPPRGTWHCEQSLKPWAQALIDAGIDSQARIDSQDHALVLVLPPRQRDETRSLLARAVQSARTGGVVVAAAANQAGGRTLADDLRALTGTSNTASKFKCRLAWGRVEPNRIDTSTLAAWLALDEPRWLDVEGESFCTRPGLFAWDRIDTASKLLAEHLPDSLAGRAADLGAGWGYLSLQLLRRCPGITAIDLYEANARALEPARQNLAAALGERTAPRWAVHWHDVTTGLPTHYDLVISNPPFHLDRADQPLLGQAFLDTAAKALNRNGEAWIVANRHLPYEALLGERFTQVERIVQRDGFKVMRAFGPKP